MNKLVIVWAALLGAAGCGYHVSGKADLMPATIKTIAIPAFGNRTIRYKLARQLPADLTREFISRTRYKIVTDPQAADAVFTDHLADLLWTMHDTKGEPEAVYP